MAPRRDGTLFWGDRRAASRLGRDAFVGLAGKGLTPGGCWGAGVSPAGYSRAAPRTGDLTPLPWQRLVKSRRAGGRLQRGCRDRSVGGGGASAPLRCPQHEPCPRQRRRLRLTPGLPTLPVPPCPKCHHARQGVPHLHAAHHRGGEGAAGTDAPMEGWGAGLTPRAAPGDRFLPWEGHGDPFAVARLVAWMGMGMGCSVPGPSCTLGCGWGGHPDPGHGDLGARSPTAAPGHGRTKGCTSRRRAPGVWIPVARRGP